MGSQQLIDRGSFEGFALGSADLVLKTDDSAGLCLAGIDALSFAWTIPRVKSDDGGLSAASFGVLSNSTWQYSCDSGPAL